MSDIPINFCGKTDIYDSPYCGYEKRSIYQCDKCKIKDRDERIEELKRLVNLRESELKIARKAWEEAEAWLAACEQKSEYQD